MVIYTDKNHDTELINNLNIKNKKDVLRTVGYSSVFGQDNVNGCIAFEEIIYQFFG